MPEKTYIVRLFFRNALHIGSPRSGAGVESSLDFIHSDTLWAAIANYWAIIGSANGISFKDFLDSFRRGNNDESTKSSNVPLFTISSAFLFSVKGRDSRYCLPKPLSVSFGLSQLNQPDKRSNESKQFAKTLKSSRFISREHFAGWQEFTRPMGRSVFLEQSERIGDDAIRPQSAIDRLTNNSNLFHSALTYMEPVSDRDGLYFLVRTADDSVVGALETVLQVIIDAGGIGGDVSSGCGELRSCTIRQIQDDDDSWACLRGPENPNAHCLLSLCIPSSTAHSSDQYVAYDTVIRKGWTGSLSTTMQRKRKTVHMLSEGSVLVSREPGCLVTLTPDLNVTPEWRGLHDIYRYGFAFLVPIRINLND
jgi:CRISPR-associated protein Csm4